MGTHSTYRLIEDVDGKKQNIALIYFHNDGYPDGHPLNTAKWLLEAKLVNGYSGSDNENTYNGAGCLFATFITKVKNRIGNVYLCPQSYRGKSGENYLYDIIIKDNDIKIIAYNSNKRKFFEGTPAEYVEKYG